MQFIPFYKSYTILESHYILTDDTSNTISLCKIKAIDKNDKEIILLEVIGLRKEYYGTKDKSVVAHHDIAFWKGFEHKCFNGFVNGYMVEEYDDGKHCLFSEDYFNKQTYGLRTKFKILTNGCDSRQSA